VNAKAGAKRATDAEGLFLFDLHNKDMNTVVECTYILLTVQKTNAGGNKTQTCPICKLRKPATWNKSPRIKSVMPRKRKQRQRNKKPEFVFLLMRLLKTSHILDEWGSTKSFACCLPSRRSRPKPMLRKKRRWQRQRNRYASSFIFCLFDVHRNKNGRLTCVIYIYRLLLRPKSKRSRPRSVLKSWKRRLRLRRRWLRRKKRIPNLSSPKLVFHSCSVAVLFCSRAFFSSPCLGQRTRRLRACQRSWV